MRLYHFVNEQHGLDNIRQRRIKIATFQELNDPFELMGINCSEELIRDSFMHIKAELSKSKGILCFSRRWSNPVMWSHYADRHKGLCLGFDVPDDTDIFRRVSYTSKRIISEIDKLQWAADAPDPAFNYIKQLLFTKFSHWKYEQEVRGYKTLEEKDPISRLFFANFSDELKLREIIVGAYSSISRETVNEALGSMTTEVRIIKACLALQTFKVVGQRNKRLWL